MIRSKCYYATCLLVGALPYIPALFYKAYVMDDAVAVQRNVNVISSTVTWTDLMSRDFWGLELFAGTWTHKSFRPVTTWTYRLGYLMHGTDSSGFHAASVLFHIVCSFVVGLALKNILKLTKEWTGVTMLLFAVHPVHTENVLYLVGRADVLASVFFLAAILVAHRTDWSRDAFLSIAVFTLAGGLSKETGFTAPLIAAAFDVLGSGSFKRPKAGWLLVLGLTLMRWRHWYTNGTEVNMSVQDNPVSFETEWTVRIFSYALLHAKYLELLLFPIKLCYDYSLTAIPIVREGTDVRLLYVVAAYLVITGTLWWMVRLYLHPGSRAMGKRLLMCAVLIVVPWLPASNIMFPVGTVIGERLLYTPSVGYIGLLVVIGSAIRNQKRAMQVAVCVAAFWWVRTALRVSDWQDGDTLFLRDGHAQPASSKTQFNLGITHMTQKNYDKAIAALTRCAAADPMSALPYWRIGQIEILRGNFTAAEAWLMEASTKFSATLMIKDEEIFHDIAVAVFQNKKVDRAHFYLSLALEINSRFPKGLNNYGCLLASSDPTKGRTQT